MRHVHGVVRFVATAALAVCLSATAEGQQCNDFNGCTANDMCVDGTCTGTPAGGGSCDDFNECTVNDRCVSNFGEITCMGDPAPVGTECQGGCGTCQSLSPIPLPGIPLTCSPKTSLPQTCQPAGLDDLGPCYPGRCMQFGGGGFAIVACVPQQLTCPDTDGNACTDACNPQTGRCERIEKTCGYPECTRCDPATGSCVNVNEGRACDDFNECTAQSRCGPDGLCIAGVPTPGGATATPTTAAANTPTPTNTVQAATPTMPTGAACPCDCNRDGTVAINEVITAVNIGQETLALSACPAADTNGNGAVAINEIILGVGAGLNGCPS